MCDQSAGPMRYAIRIQGHLDPGRSEWLGGLTITPLESGETDLAGPVADQAALHGLLARIRDLNLTLISITRVEPELPQGDKDENSDPVPA